MTKPCRCRGRSGAPKQRYRSRLAALRVAMRRGWTPIVYRCPQGKGYHIANPHLD